MVSNTLSKEKIKQLANQLMFDLSDQEIEEIQKEFSTLIDQMKLLNDIDTQNVEPMVYPFEEPTTLMRSDDDDEPYHLSLKDVLMNAPDAQDDYFVVPKVVD